MKSGWKSGMAWQWSLAPAVVCVLLLTGAHGQQQGQIAAPQSTESEITTRTSDTTIKVRVNLVQVRVVVKDASGKIVPDLKQEDFQVLDNGKKQKISAFNVETEATPDQSATAAERKVAGTETADTAAATAAVMPKRFVALVFDDSHMKTADSMAVRAATQKLFATLTPTDRVAIYSTTGTVRQDFTADVETLRKTLASIIPRPAKGEGQYQCPNVSYYQADLIANKHDRDAITTAAVDSDLNGCPVDLRQYAEQILREGDSLTSESYESLENIVRHLSNMPGQRVLTYVSPGFVLGDQVLPTGWGWIEQAVRVGVVVNTIDARGLYTADVMPDISAPPQAAPYRGPDWDYRAWEGKYRMQSQFESGLVLAGMAAATGGTFFHNRNDLDVGISRAMAAPAVSYILGFAPQDPKFNGKFHKLKVLVVNRKKYQIQARNGYYASQTPVGDPEEIAKQAVREALFSRDETVNIPVKLDTQLPKVDATSAQLTVLTHLDVRGIRFRKEDALSCSDLLVATGVFDANGQLVNGEMKEVTLRLQDSTLAKMIQTGFTVQNDFTVKPGTYLVRSVVRGSEGEQLTARNLATVITTKPRTEAAKQPSDAAKNIDVSNLHWTPPKVDARLKSLSMNPPCDLSDVLQHAAENSLLLTSNLEKFTAQEHVEYVELDHSGMVEQFDSGSFDYVYSAEPQNGGKVSREYRTPVKGSHAFRESEQDIGQAAIAVIFRPDLQTDYEMSCEGADERNGQLDWVVHFQQRKDRPSHTATFWVNGVSYPGKLKGRAWISRENFQVTHLEADLTGDLPAIGLQALSFAVDYQFVRSPSGNLDMWLPSSMVIYKEFEAHRVIVAHTLADFRIFTVATTEEVQNPKPQQP